MKKQKIILSESDKENLKVILKHIKKDISYKGNGTFEKESEWQLNPDESLVDRKEVKKAKIGISIIEMLIEKL